MNGRDELAAPQVWIVSYDHWGESGSTIVAVCATEESARVVVTQQTFKLDYQIEPWDVTQ